MRILGIDYGARKVGLSMGDTDSKIATPWSILQNTGHGDLIKQIIFVCEREQVERVVVGVPLSLRDADAENDQLRSVRTFIADLRVSGIPVDEMDEKLSSAEARRYTKISGASEDDAVAASIMLQSYLERI